MSEGVKLNVLPDDYVDIIIDYLINGDAIPIITIQYAKISLYGSLLYG